MFNAHNNNYLVPFTGFSLADVSTSVETDESKKELKKRLKTARKSIKHLQETLYAQDKFSVLLVFQAMDAAGKDSTIRSVFTGINPTLFQVSSFKQPSKRELDHDFLWRTVKALPEKGRIGIFNRSYYEEVLVVRVHPEYLGSQRLPFSPSLDANEEDNLWSQRYESIVDHEKHLARNGTMVIKFFLNVSQQEQHKRFLSRIVNSHKNWKFSSGDLAESALWQEYMQAYDFALGATSRPYAPWYCVPADDKLMMQVIVAETVLENLKQLPLDYPTLSEEQLSHLDLYKEQLLKE